MYSLLSRIKNWLYYSQTFVSEKNKAIRCERVWGTWRVFVDGYHETSPLLEMLWKRAFQSVPREAVVKNVLILGFGAGGSLGALYKKFPDCCVWSVEHDPVMVELAKRINPRVENSKHTILVADAYDAVTSISQTFDLILFDCYTGDAPSPLIYEKAFVSGVQKHLNKDGYLLVNMFKHAANFGYFNDYFFCAQEWTMATNHFARYTHLK